jgi:hypothetical protein
MSVSVPGIPDGEVNPLVVSHGVMSPLGVGDVIQNPIEGRKQHRDRIYAESYNTHLLKYLLAHPDPKTALYLRKVRAELLSLKSANPQDDATRDFQKRPMFISVAGVRDAGYPIDDSRTSWIHLRWLASSEITLSGTERVLFKRVVKNYVVPYNKAMYWMLKQKWDEQGIKNRM